MKLDIGEASSLGKSERKCGGLERKQGGLFSEI